MANLLTDTPEQTKARVAKTYGIGPYPVRLPNNKVDARRYMIELLALAEVALDKAIENPKDQPKFVGHYTGYIKQYNTIGELFDTLPPVSVPGNKEVCTVMILP